MGSVSVPKSYYRTINGNMAEKLFNDITQKKISSLYLCENVILMEGATIIVKKLKLSSVTVLICRRNMMKDQALQILSEGLNHTKITHVEFDFENDIVDRESQKALAKGLSHTKIIYCKINVKSVEEFSESLARYLEHTKIRTLDLSNCEIGDSGLKALAPSLKRSQVRKLRLCWNNIGHKGVKTLAENLGCTKLEVLDLFGNKIDAKGVEAIAKNLNGSSLSTLILDRNDISNNGVEALSKRLSCSRITNLSVQCCKIDDTGIKSLARGAEKSEITNLSISMNDMHKSVNAKALAECLRKTQIQVLNLSRMERSTTTISILSECLQHSRLTHLYLGKGKYNLQNIIWDRTRCNPVYIDRYVCADSAIALASGLKHSALVHLDLGGNKIEEEGAKALAECLKFTRITHLNLGRNEICNEGAMALAKGLKTSEVTFLSLCNNLITEDGVIALAESLKDTKVAHFDFSFNSLGSKGAIFLAENIQKTQLQRLDLSYTRMSTDSAVLFASRLKGTQLTYLSLEYNFIGMDVVEALVKSLKETHITALDLGSNYMYENVVIRLVEGLQGSHVTYLNLTQNVIRADTVRALGRCIRNTCIVHLILNFEDVDSDTVDYLADCLSHTQIFDLVLDDNDNYTEKLFRESTFMDYETQDRAIVADIVNLNVSAYVRLRNTMFDNWKNAQYFVHLFKCVVSIESGTNSLDFTTSGSEDVEEYVNKCLQFLKMITDAPGMTAHIILEKDIHYTPEQIKEFITNSANKFSLFVACRLDANVDDYVTVLKKCEELQLNNVVASLLLHRPLYTIDTEKSILHPYAYELLKKYDQVMYQENIEPLKKSLILDYFKQHPEIDGAGTICNLFS